MLPAQSACLSVPLVEPSAYEEAWAHRQRDAFRDYRDHINRTESALVSQSS